MNFAKGKKRDINRVLGAYAISSHPDHYVRRRQICILFSVLPLLGLVAFLLIKFLFDFHGTTSHEEVLEAIFNFFAWFKNTLSLLIGLFVFAIGFGCCGLLIILAERYPRFSLWGESSRSNIKAPWWWVFGIAVFIGSCGVLTILLTDSSNLDFVVSLLLTGPILLLILLLGPVQDWLHGNATKGNRVLAALSFIILGFIISLYASSYVAGWTNSLLKLATDQISPTFWESIQSYDHLPEWMPKEKGNILKGLDDIFRSLIVTINIAFLASYLLWRKPVKKKKKPKVQKKTFIHKVFGFCKRAVGVRSPISSEEVEIHGWHSDFKTMETPLQGCDVINEEGAWFRDLNQERFAELEHSKACENSKYLSFFDETLPSQDQDKAMSKFLNRVQREWGAIRSGDETAFDTGDMLITGAEGSGRKQWVEAAAIAARHCRGDIVLIICKNSIEASSMVKSIRQANSRSPVPYLLHIDQMNTNIKAALQADRLSALPDILVATRSEMENAFFQEGERAGTGKSGALRMIDTVLVTDISEFSSEDRFELPFLLGKIRLINEVDHKVVQVVVVAPTSVGEDGYIKELVTSRLLSPIRKIPEPFKLKPLKSSAADEYFIETSDTAAAFTSLAEYFLLKGHFVVIINDSNEGSQENLSNQNLLPPGIPSTHLQIVSSIEDISINDSKISDENGINKKRWCIVLQSYVCGQVGISLPSVRNVAGIAVFHLSESVYQKSDFTEHISEVFLPVLGSAKSDSSTLTRELAKVVPYLSLKRPVHRNVWRQFGIPKPGSLAPSDPDSEEKLMSQHFEFKIDPPEAAVGQEPIIDELHRVERVMQLEHRGTPLTVNHNGVEDLAYRLRLSPSNTRIQIVTTKLLAKQFQRMVVWDADGQVFPGSQGILDLAKADKLLIETDGGKFVPHSKDIDAQGRLKIKCRRSIELYKEDVHPIWSGTVSIPEEISLSRQSINGPEQIAWYRILRGDGSLAAADAEVKWKLKGTYTGGQLVLPGKPKLLDSPIYFEYEACSSLLMLGNFEQVQQGDVVGEWSIEDKQNKRTFWPELTAALMAGLVACTPDAARLARVLAFRHDENLGCASVLVIGLPDTSGTFEELFLLIQESKKLRQKFYKKAISVLNESMNKSDGELFHVLAASALQSMGDFNTPLDCAAAIEILDSISVGDIS
jgi:hypothetical protein